VNITRVALAGLLAGMALSSAAAVCKVRSAEHRVALVELYTSQGCSSCPPADRWLSSLAQRFRSNEAIPLALHVGYWDYIGWKDPFAKPEFMDRQRQWAAANANRTVYTPGVFVQGGETREWQVASELARRVKATNALPAGAHIELAAQLEGPRIQVDVLARAASAAAGTELRVALTQNNLRTAVKAGENNGEKLGNDHVVREWSAALPLGQHRINFTLPAGAQARDLALVAFVQAGPGKDILQAVQWSQQACL
jgi:hypothetical protein